MDEDIYKINSMSMVHLLVSILVSASLYLVSPRRFHISHGEYRLQDHQLKRQRAGIFNYVLRMSIPGHRVMSTRNPLRGAAQEYRSRAV